MSSVNIWIHSQVLVLVMLAALLGHFAMPINGTGGTLENVRIPCFIRVVTSFRPHLAMPPVRPFDTRLWRYSG